MFHISEEFAPINKANFVAGLIFKGADKEKLDLLQERVMLLRNYIVHAQASNLIQTRIIHRLNKSLKQFTKFKNIDAEKKPNVIDKGRTTNRHYHIEFFDYHSK